MNERGGAVGGLLAAIGFVVVLMAIIFAVCVSTAGSAPVQHRSMPAIERHRGCDPEWGECDDGGNRGYDGRGRNENSRHRNRGAFSPGPFQDSPVDAFNNDTVCLPGSTCYTGESSTTTTTRGGR